MKQYIGSLLQIGTSLDQTVHWVATSDRYKTRGTNVPAERGAERPNQAPRSLALAQSLPLELCLMDWTSLLRIFYDEGSFPA